MATFSLLPESLDITVCKGDECGLSLEFSEGGTASDLTGYTFSAVIFSTTRTVSSSYPGGFDAEGATAETISVTYTDLANGEIGLSLTEAQTDGLDETATYRWYLRGVAPGTITRTYISGSFTVRTP